MSYRSIQSCLLSCKKDSIENPFSVSFPIYSEEQFFNETEKELKSERFSQSVAFAIIKNEL